MSAPCSIFASCAPGLEPLLAAELASLKALAHDIMRGAPPPSWAAEANGKHGVLAVLSVLHELCRRLAEAEQA